MYNMYTFKENIFDKFVTKKGDGRRTLSLFKL